MARCFDPPPASTDCDRARCTALGRCNSAGEHPERYRSLTVPSHPLSDVPRRAPCPSPRVFPFPWRGLDARAVQRTARQPMARSARSACRPRGNSVTFRTPGTVSTHGRARGPEGWPERPYPPSFASSFAPHHPTNPVAVLAGWVGVRPHSEPGPTWDRPERDQTKRSTDACNLQYPFSKTTARVSSHSGPRSAHGPGTPCSTSGYPLRRASPPWFGLFDLHGTTPNLCLSVADLGSSPSRDLSSNRPRPSPCDSA